MVLHVRLEGHNLREAYRRHFVNPRRERAFLSAAGFTFAFATCRVVTHSIRAGVGPFHNMSAGGRHLHHSTFGILGQIGLGYIWTYQWALGLDPSRRSASRASAIVYGITSALTLDEFALWFDLQDDYWDAAGRKSIDAVALFGGASTMGVAGKGLFRELARATRLAVREARRGCSDAFSSGCYTRDRILPRAEVGIAADVGFAATLVG